MTFSIAMRCAETGQFGVAGTTSSMAIGGRCFFADQDAGVVITQHRTDPRLGPQGLELLRNGNSAQQVIDLLAASTQDIEWRELAVVDSTGGTALRQGAREEPLFANARAPGIVAVGNILRNEQVPGAMIKAAQAASDLPVAERLLAALSAGLAAGGEIYQLKSAALKVTEHPGFASVDLRVDSSQDPINDLAALWNSYAPDRARFVKRVLTPDADGRATCSADLLAEESRN